MLALEELLERSAAHHHHICPRQVLGVRIGMCAAAVLGLDLPQKEKRLYAFVETDGCTVDGISASTGCYVGRRTMQIQDFGKIAATFVDTETGRAVRIWPHPQARQAAAEYQRCGLDRWHAYLEAYKELPAAGLLKFQEVTLNVSMQAIISRNAARAVCARCGEEIFNEREVFQDGQILCRGCAGQSYFSIDPHAP